MEDKIRRKFSVYDSITVKCFVNQNNIRNGLCCYIDNDTESVFSFGNITSGKYNGVWQEKNRNNTFDRMVTWKRDIRFGIIVKFNYEK